MTTNKFQKNNSSSAKKIQNEKIKQDFTLLKLIIYSILILYLIFSFLYFSLIIFSKILCYLSLYGILINLIYAVVIFLTHYMIFLNKYDPLQFV